MDRRLKQALEGLSKALGDPRTYQGVVVNSHYFMVILTYYRGVLKIGVVFWFFDDKVVIPSLDVRVHDGDHVREGRLVANASALNGEFPVASLNSLWIELLVPED